MKGESRQHGVVRSFPIFPSPLSQQRNAQTVDTTSVADIFTRVSRKPIKESKLTGKCGKARYASCHIYPACKSKDKTKGTMKLRSNESGSGVSGYPAGISATSALAYLANEASYDAKDEYDGVINEYDYGYETNCNIE